MNETIHMFHMGQWGALEIELPDDAEKRYEGLKAAELPYVPGSDICDEHGSVVGHWLEYELEDENDFVFPIMAELRIGNRYATALILDPPSYVAFSHFPFMRDWVASETHPPKAKRARKPKETIRRHGNLTLVK
jgi:hypothetical protein